MKKDLQTKRVALYGILGALSLVLSLFEHILIPDIPFLPAGAKPGLSNIAVMLTAYAVSSTGAVYIFLLKVLFAFITRGATAALMSFSGGLLSIIVLLLLVKNEGKSYSFITIGILCAIGSTTFDGMGIRSTGISAVFLLYAVCIPPRPFATALSTPLKVLLIISSPILKFLYFYVFSNNVDFDILPFKRLRITPVKKPEIIAKTKRYFA